MANHRAPRRRLFSRAPKTTAVPETQFDKADLPVEPTIEDDDSAVHEELAEFFEDEPSAPVARVVDLAERRARPITEIVMGTRTATDASVKAVYPDGRIDQVSCELRVVATLPEILDGMILNVTGGGRSAAIAVTRSP